MYRVLLIGLFAFIRATIAGYGLEDDYSTVNFFNMFNFFDGNDPTHGFVDFVDQGTAWNSGLIKIKDNRVYMGVDYTNRAPNGRASVRISSKKAYNQGLIILDLDHMPGPICGVWPAFWTLGGPNWPDNGEIDILEGVNDQTTNHYTLHTGPGCKIGDTSGFLGSITTPNCDVNAPGQSNNAGCSIADPDSRSYRDFNANGGGVFATEWTSDAITLWFFPRGSIPNDIYTGNPIPATWGTPTARFRGGCNIPSYFRNHNLIFDTTFCGDWAGNVWGSSPSCSYRAPTCNDFVRDNPSAFRDAYWSINSLKVYSNRGNRSPDSLLIPNATVSIPANVTSKVPEPTFSSLSSLIPSFGSSVPEPSTSVVFVTLNTTVFASETPEPLQTVLSTLTMQTTLFGPPNPEETEIGGLPRIQARDRTRRRKHILEHRKRHGGYTF
ncbi:glycoside hydrolase family 16 protein [Patellaria atrata CBS 101060]|uniref:endo-1,3(4)-beta-glucanase n=1 Tax=Patellaria atrata CBS 101060 TaxID=1346257 RepID=A0A9P4S781_9PEZI|nr:glycoside hydrolase family 16 protein [Patellaria atrata CBS 101060]